MATDVSANDARFAAESSPDVTAEKIGDVYAGALFGALDNHPTKIGEVLDEYGGFISEALSAFPDFETILSGRLVSTEDKTAMIDRVFASRLSPVFLNFLRIVAKHERLDCLRAIYAQAREKYDELLGRVKVVVTSAAPIPADSRQKLTAALRTMLKGEPDIICEVNSSLIGGLVVRVGDTIYDGSVAAQLNDICRNVIKSYSPSAE